jgi:hypothetical protein
MWTMAHALAIVIVAAAIPTPSLRAAVPSNDTAAFRMFDLASGPAPGTEVTSHPIFSECYPDWLESVSLLVTRTPGSTDTVGLFNPDSRSWPRVIPRCNPAPVTSFRCRMLRAGPTF